MHVEWVSQAVAVFAVTNVDDVVLLALYFARARGDRAAAWRVVAGQYLGFVAILGASVAGALGAALLPPGVVPYLGLLPLVLGIRAARRAWRRRPDGEGDGDDPDDDVAPVDVPALTAVAGVTFANGGDNIGVYVPVFTTTGPAGMVVYGVVFLLLVGVWCAVGRFLATRRPVARALARQGHVVLPLVLIALGLVILIQGGAFGL